MDFKVGDIVITKKAHPCGSSEWSITRVGMDFRMVCHGCGRELMLPRKKAEKSIKSVVESRG